MAEGQPRGTCSVCGKDVALKKDGTVRGHGFTHTPTTYWCQGSMEAPAESGVGQAAPDSAAHSDTAPIAVPDVGYNADLWPKDSG